MRYLLIALAVSACARPKPAPTTLEDLGRFLFRNQDSTSAVEGLVNLETWLASSAADGKGLHSYTSLADRSWSLATLQDEDVAVLPKRPNRPLKKALATAVAYVSPGSIACHAVVQSGNEQTPMESTARTYVRTFPNETNPACFVDRSCTELMTKNEILRASALFEAQLVLFKKYKWFEYEVDGQPRKAFFSRGWAEESFDSTDGPAKNQLWQNYSIDVWIERGSEVWRFQVLWSESDVYVAETKVDDDTQLATVTSTLDGIFAAGDRYIKDTLKPAGRCP